MATAAASIDGLERAPQDGASVTADGGALQAQISGIEIRRPRLPVDNDVIPYRSTTD